MQDVCYGMVWKGLVSSKNIINIVVINFTKEF